MVENKEVLIRGIPTDDSIEDIEEILDTKLDYHKWLNEPAARAKFKEITKDLPMSNLDQQELFLVRNFGDFMKQLESMGLNKAKQYFNFQLDFLLNAALGKGGFARRLDQTVIQKAEIIQKEPQERRFWGLKGGASSGRK